MKKHLAIGLALGTSALALAVVTPAFLVLHRAPADGASARSHFTSSIARDADCARAGADESWWRTVSDQIEREEYHATFTPFGLQAPNRAHGLRTTFRMEGIEVMPREAEASVGGASWCFAWRLAAWGRRESLKSVGPVAPVVDGVCVTYGRPGLREWYENTAKGLEQGFEVSEAPPGEGPLCLEGKVSDDLRAELDAYGGAVDFVDAHGARVLRYAELIVLDATGQEIPSRLVLSGNALTIEIDDAGATYPLLVDPLMTSPAWTAESNQIAADFGNSVATAGDVNGDGFSDVIVGAPKYDNGEDSEGRAFVYLGSPAGLATTPAWAAESNNISADFGWSVATAGDVNGDGFSDVVVGAREYSNPEIGEGRAYVYHGSTAGLAATAAWTAESNHIGAGFGTSVAWAGDVNGDGFADVIVGAHAYDNGQDAEGRAFVFHGSVAGLASTAAWTAESNQADAFFGSSVSTAGDVNGDGFADILVGAEGFDNGQNGEGRAFAYYGSALGLATTPSWTAEGNQDIAFFGGSAAAAGDVNGDGFSDVIVGALGYDNGQDGEGRAFTFHGSAAGLATTAAWTAESNQPGALFGYSVATAGDVNGDGFSDAMVGALHYENGESREGRAFVYQGSAAGLGTIPVWTAESDQEHGQLGISVATAGDVNGDGYSDVIAGAQLFDNGEPDEGRAYVYHGSAAGLSSTSAWSAESNQAGAQFGVSVATAGDVNGDGYSDLIVGADLYDNVHGGDEGRAFVYYGSATGPSTSYDWTAAGGLENARFGNSVATAGDVNGDGYSDVIVGAHFHDFAQNQRGRVYVYHGSAAGLGTAPAWFRNGGQSGATFGRSVGTAGDVNGDGFSDVIIGANLYENGSTDEGRAFVYHGSPTGLGIAPAWTAESNQPGAEFGVSVGTAGDVNGDGYSDVLVGADWYSNGQSNEGRAFVYHGSAGGLGTNAVWTAESDQAGARFGYSVATAGDVNGDGYSDVLAGAFAYDTPQSDGGRAYFYYGSATGLQTSPRWIAESGQVGARYGISVGPAGDVNGDGFSDFIVGIDSYESGESNEGWVAVYRGSAAGPLTSFVWYGEGGQVDAAFGHSAATAGDVNGDGFSDLVVGAYGYDNGQSNEGRLFLYYGNEGDGLDRIAHQARADNTAPIDLLGLSDSPTSFHLKALGRTPAGRGNVRLQWEVEPFGTPFDGIGLGTGPGTDTGAPSLAGSAVSLTALAGSLSAETLYHWRLRILGDSPFFPRSPWHTLSGNAVTEADVRTAAGSNAVAEQLSPQYLFLESSTPNPFATTTQITYSLPERGSLRLAVYDVLGREVARLAGGVAEAGGHTALWDGRDARGRELPNGVYFLRLEFAGSRTGSRKIVIAR